jgi:hypothetical protein
MIYVNNTSNQLNITYDTRKDVYAFDSIKSVSFSWDANVEYYVIINFIANDKNNSLRIYLKDVDPTLMWTNDFSGATLAVNTIAGWMDEAISVKIIEPIGQLNNAKSVSVTLSSDQERLAITPKIRREELNTSSISADCYSISFASVGTVAALISFDSGVGYVSIAPGTTINMDAGGLNNYYAGGTFYYNTTAVGAILIITYNV